MSPTALIVLAPGAEEIEFIAIADLLVRAGATVTVASTVRKSGSPEVRKTEPTAGAAAPASASADELPTVRGSRGLALAADTTLDAVQGVAFDLVYLPGGGGSAAACRDDARVQALIGTQLRSGRLLAAICAAPTALIAGGHLAGRAATSFPGARAAVAAAAREWLDQPVVIDGQLITSQAAGTSLHLGLVLAARLCGEPAARRVAADILCPVVISESAFAALAAAARSPALPTSALSSGAAV